MSVILFDGFDHDDTVHRWTSRGASTTGTSPVRTGTRSQSCASGGVGPWIAFDPQEDDTIYMGFGFYNPGVGGDITMLIFSEASNLSVGHIGLIRRGPIRGWELRKGASVADSTAGTLLGTVTPNVWFPDSWHYIELGAKIHDTTGWAELRQDGITRLRFDGDTRNGGTDGLIDMVTFNQRTNAGDYRIDDVYILNEQGSIPALTTWLGDTRMFPLYPIGDGFYLMLVGSDADSIDNWVLVDEAGTPITTDFVFSATVGDKDTYEFEDLPVTVGTVRGIEIRVHAAKSDTGTKQFRTIDRRAGTDAFQPDHTLAAIPLYQTHHDILEQDPHAGPGDWTIPNINATEWGVEVRS